MRGFAKYDCATAMFFELGLPVFNTVVHNAKMRLAISTTLHVNRLVKLLHDLRIYATVYCFFSHFSVFLFLLLLCHSMSLWAIVA